MLLDETVKKFTSFCRTGILDPSLSLDPERAQSYFTLIRNNFDDSLRRAYPLTHHLVKSETWNEMVDDFFANHDSSSPFPWRMPEGFARYVKKSQWAKRLKIPYLNDLVDFEWLEIELFMMPDSPQENFTKEGSLLDDPLYLNPESTIALYRYPVFEKKPLPREMEKGMYPLLAFRYPEKGTVHFVALSSYFQKVVEALRKEPLTGRQALLKPAKKFQLKEEQVLPSGEKFLSDLFSQQAILGFKK
jgi:uncharacterized protein